MCVCVEPFVINSIQEIPFHNIVRFENLTGEYEDLILITYHHFDNPAAILKVGIFSSKI